MAKKIVLAYSGGLDTSVAIKWLQEKYGYQVIALSVDVGEAKDLESVRQKALDVGAIKSYVIDAKDDFIKNYVFPALQANATYEGKYPLSSALSRPLIAKLLVEIAEREGAEAVAHGCTGKGNDQVRFDVSVSALNPDLSIVAPVREWPMSREAEIQYAKAHGIPVPVGEANPYSIDENVWGRSIECGVLENPWLEAPEDVFKWTVAPEAAPDEPKYLDLTFEAGIPVAINGSVLDPVSLLSQLNQIGGRHGIGRIDHVENRLVGIKSREIYEAPAAVLLLHAHQELESFTLPRDLGHFKAGLSGTYSQLAYEGLWYSPLREALDAFMASTQKHVTGTVRVKMYKGSAQVVGRKSPYSLYDEDLATYGGEDAFDHAAAEGFIKIWGLPTVVYAATQRKQRPVNVQERSTG